MGKVSFTHLIGYAIVRAIADAVPAMHNTFVEGADGKPRLVAQRHTSTWASPSTSTKADGSRTLVVPVIRDADTLDFAGFLAAYEELIRKVKANKLTVDDFQGANVTLTNPGTIGTVQSVPRLMPGQGVIVGVGSIDYPAEFEGADRANLSSLGVSKVVTITSTYDHRIIQGAESGLFLKRVHELLLGEHGFYDDVFALARHAVRGGASGAPTSTRSTAKRRCCSKQMQVATLIRVHRVRGHLIADLDPLRWKEPAMPERARPGDVRADDLGPRPRVPHRRRRRHREDDARRPARRAARRLLPHDRHRVHAHPGHRGAALDPVQGRGRRSRRSTRTQKHRILERLNAAEAFEKFLATKYVGTKRFGLEGAESAIPILDEILSAAADAGLDSCRARHGPPRPAQRAVEHHRQELRRDLPRVRGPRRPDVGAGLGRRQVPPRRDRQVRQPVGRRHPARAGRQPEPPRDGRPDRAWAWCAPARTRSTRRARTRCCRS